MRVGGDRRNKRPLSLVQLTHQAFCAIPERSGSALVTQRDQQARASSNSGGARAATGGHSMKAMRAQLGHRSLKSTEQYAHLAKRAQLRIVADLEPSSPPPAP